MRRELKAPSKARLVVALMWRPGLELPLSEVELYFGRIASQSEVFDFDFTNYYVKEMGSGLKKCFVEIEGLVPRNSLADHKHQAVKLEEQHLLEGTRLLNVDPMLVSLENVVIATSKNFPHRIYLGEGVFGDLALVRKRSGFESFPWTYKDYVEHLPFFESVHSRLRAELHD